MNGVRAACSTPRHINSPLCAVGATAHDFYDRAGYGGIEEPLPTGKGVRSTLADGTVISMREASESDGTPVVEISIRRSTDNGGVEKQKIHIELGRDE